ncbi:MAG: excinuclease ABC subunit C [Candidatus Schekmanbacteria bacterium GWA2_38_11]|uniref:UvrABC system protein C n=1 Tax=Candidatus Schekmanbacteria bacterium GWA2_38_11 TaxID=1817876 RepID=A0A1F7RDJ1_9BACT|nr:MAG: excinuclease ABC subunit C [Candidatus Schekmanbacteria bacterium GWA2_38_11]
MELEEKIRRAPDSPGVYIFKDSRNNIIYVGKARSISKRVKSYLRDRSDKTPKTISLIEKIADIQYITTDNELEALLLENNLIKRHKPIYNIRLRDDKTYPYLKLTTNEKFPRLLITRKLKEDGAVYFGPFTPVGAIKGSLKILAKIFQICTCKKPFDGKPTRPCLNFQMGLCSGPCCGLIAEEKYSEIVRRVKTFLEGKTKEVLRYFQREMEKSASSLNFEAAAKYRDTINAIEKMLERQRVVVIGGNDHDAIAASSDENRIVFCVLIVRQGRIVGHLEYPFEDISYLDEDDACESFLRRYYERETVIPEEILIYRGIRDVEVIQDWLKGRKGKSVKIIFPQRGKKLELIKMAQENALLALKQYQDVSANRRNNLLEAKDFLNLVNLPERIEAIDISNISGKMGVGSLVVWKKGKFRKDQYRKFKIKTISTPDDYQMISEVITRRYKRLIEEKSSLPDLVLIDGGKGQLNIANETMEKLGIKEIDVIAIAKGRSILRDVGREGLGEYSEEEIFTLIEEPVRFKRNSPVLHLFQSIRDEAHRFAITYHKTLRRKTLRHSALDEIPGVGEKKKKDLLNYFGSVEKIRQSTVEELCQVRAIDKKTAIQIVNHLRKIT